MAISVQITGASLTEGNPTIAAILPAYSYLSEASIIKYSFTGAWSGASKVTKVEATIDVRNASGRVGWVLAASDATIATSGSKTYTGTFFNPILATGYGPGVTSLSDGSYSVVFSFSVWNGSSGTNAPASTFSITYTTYRAPSVTTFDVYRANASGTRTDDGTYLRYSVAASVYKVTSTDTGSFTLRHRLSGASTWTNITLGSNVASVNVSGAQISGSFPISNSYECELVIADRYSSVTSSKLIPTGSVLMHFKADKSGVGIGKYAETANLLDVALPTKFGAGVAIGKNADSGSILDVNYPARFRQAVSMDSPLALAQGGTGATSAAAALTNLGIRKGVSAFTCKSANYIDVSVTFSPAFSSTPQAVVLTPEATFSTANSVNGWSILSKSATGFTYRFYHEGSNTPVVNMYWIAIQ